MSDQVGTPQMQDPPPIAGKITPGMESSMPLVRPDWDHYFLKLAEDVSTRSPDPNTQHGCVLVDPDQVIVSTGYNGPVRGFPHQLVPTTRPEKYDYMIHAEDNACLFAHRSLKGATAYITGPPCSACFRRLAQAGIVRIVHAGRSSKCVDEAQQRACEQMATHLNIPVHVIRSPADRAIEGLTNFVDEPEKSQKKGVSHTDILGKINERNRAIEGLGKFEKDIVSPPRLITSEVMREHFGRSETPKAEPRTFTEWWKSDHSVDCRSGKLLDHYKGIARVAWDFAFVSSEESRGSSERQFLLWWNDEGDRVSRVARDGTAPRERTTRTHYVCRTAWEAAGGAP